MAETAISNRNGERLYIHDVPPTWDNNNSITCFYTRYGAFLVPRWDPCLDLRTSRGDSAAYANAASQGHVPIPLHAY